MLVLGDFLSAISDDFGEGPLYNSALIGDFQIASVTWTLSLGTVTLKLSFLFRPSRRYLMSSVLIQVLAFFNMWSWICALWLSRFTFPIKRSVVFRSVGVSGFSEVVFNEDSDGEILCCGICLIRF